MAWSTNLPDIYVRFAPIKSTGILDQIISSATSGSIMWTKTETILSSVTSSTSGLREEHVAADGECGYNHRGKLG
ncbi:hypothetical protein A1O7_09798 [Cladophialophora yegresii CBS 114405]|uniref:Uncharacterized protein n=1 Tax=Cladophialophora yegresii CBS 114405 TaxID=1182544 RepID=W9VG59_9EURO|nr:uncharacterized protein A1O7_09798 [Cladophialophora yegresii CBS 114405]EXJ54458.1 hypothetical protein A1O7_09798 [Cladophialophora yegresii CBS 114405]